MSLNRGKNITKETTNTTSVVSNHISDISSKTSNILQYNINHPLINAIYKLMSSNITKEQSEINKTQILSLKFDIPDYNSMYKFHKEYTKKDFLKALYYTINYILLKLKIKPEWNDVWIISKDKIHKIWYEKTKWIERQIRFTYDEKYKYLEINWEDAINEECDEVKIFVNYNPWNVHNNKQERYVYINNWTKLLEIENLSLWKDWKDIYWKKIKYKKHITTKKWISVEKWLQINNFSYYSTLDWFIDFDETENQNWETVLTDISIISNINIKQLNFDVYNDKINKTSLNIKVKWDVLKWTYKFKWSINVWKHIKSSIFVDWNIISTCMMWTPNENILIKSTKLIETSAVSHSNINWELINIENNQTLQSPFIWNNKIKTNCLNISNWLIKWELIINIWWNLIITHNWLIKRIIKIEKELKSNIETYRIWVEQIERDIRENMEQMSKQMPEKEKKDIKQALNIARSLLYLEPFQIEKIMKCLNYIHEKYDLDFIWWYKMKFNSLEKKYNEIISNQKTLSERKEKLQIIEKDINQLVVCIDWEITAKGKIKLYIWDKNTNKNRFPLAKDIKKWKVSIFKKYSLKKWWLIDISREEAQEILLNKKIEIS